MLFVVVLAAENLDFETRVIIGYKITSCGMRSVGTYEYFHGNRYLLMVKLHPSTTSHGQISTKGTYLIMDLLNLHEILSFYLLSLMVPRVLLPLIVHQIIASAGDPLTCLISLPSA